MPDRSKGREQTKGTHWSSRLGVWIGPTTQFSKKEHVTETATIQSENGMVEEESSQVEPMKQAGESPREASEPTTLLTTKRKTRIGTCWNIRTLYEGDGGKLYSAEEVSLLPLTAYCKRSVPV